jgi:hypothetical protein
VHDLKLGGDLGACDSARGSCDLGRPRGLSPLILLVGVPCWGHGRILCIRSASTGKSLSRNGARRPDADPIRKARFREAAREIVAKDRHDRKYGSSVDTAGAVARAMERAYREGFADAQREPHIPSAGEVRTGETIDWALIPPRPRTAFWTICLFILGKGERTDGVGHLVPAITDRGTAGWRLILPGRNFEEKPLGEKTIVPLVRLGLLELADEGPERLVVSARGRATWWLFLERGGQYPEDLTRI